MRIKLNFLGAEFKRAFKMYPRMLLQAVLLLFLIVGIGFVGMQYYGGKDAALNINVAVVQEKTSIEASLALMYVQQMQTIGSSCNFMFVKLKQGKELLDNGQISALLYIPEEMIEGINNGEEVYANVYFPKNAGAESLVLKEYINPALGMLQVAQAENYAFTDIAVLADKADSIKDYQFTIDYINLTKALNRLSPFKFEDSALQGIKMAQYYTIFGVILFLMLFGMALHPVMSSYSAAFCKQAQRQGIGQTGIMLNKFLVSYCIYLITTLVLYGLVSAISVKIGLAIPFNKTAVFSLPVILLCITTFTGMMYSLFSENVGSILSIFFVSILMIFISGGFIPLAYLSAFLQKLAEFLPVTYMKKALLGLFTGYHNPSALLVLTAFSAGFLLIAVGLRKAGDRQ